MIEYRNSQHINPRPIEYRIKTATAIAIRIAAFASSVKNTKEASRSRCHKCKFVTTLDGYDLLDLNGKRHFCHGVDRIAHEEECVTQLQKIIEYYNRCELSSFQLELKMDD
jgi:hypothetical protein